ncbi:hypothetical protein WR164_15570 [Philodulcilactobacillus myokoensis]|uniref:Surface layer protein A domain-containing protein n=1 Tax=Philodulcilactobacillus myokoensis TaxID=2929573 RepID=A0A9W6B3V0_9LACO|nr:hypothetical protein [Philodulcilactobacillus myokoensis]GLB47578.1 hypothetical protein WR164_15570 [Philodulcilactobacillus myokoensis]
MNFKKLLITLMAVINVIMTFGVANNARASSVPGIKNHYWRTYRRVYLKHHVIAERIHCVNPIYQGQRIQLKRIKRGSKVFVMGTRTSYPWYIKGKKFRNTSTDFWVVNRSSSKWLSLHRPSSHR